LPLEWGLAVVETGPTNPFQPNLKGIEIAAVAAATGAVVTLAEEVGRSIAVEQPHAVATLGVEEIPKSELLDQTDAIAVGRLPDVVFEEQPGQGSVEKAAVTLRSK